MNRSGLSRFSRFRGRRARFEHDRSDRAAQEERLRALCRTARKAGIGTTQALAERLAREGIDLAIPRLAGLKAALEGETRPLKPDVFEAGAEIPADALRLMERALDGYTTIRIQKGGSITLETGVERHLMMAVLREPPPPKVDQR